MPGSSLAVFRRFVLIGGGAFVLAACQSSDIPKQLKPIPRQLVVEMHAQDMKETGEILVRIFKESSELEVWKETADGTYGLLKNYQVCKWSGVLGPKRKEGDRQAPEGFYTVAPAQMNPKSDFYLSFNIGYPNTFDTAHGRTGSHLMVHGACSSAGCYSMTDQAAGEIFALARDAFKGGQRKFQIQAFPFRMTAENLARHRDDPNMEFWRMIKVGHDHFELTKRPPKVDVCNKRYVFNANAGGADFNPTGACPAYKIAPELEAALAAKQLADDQQLAVAIAALKADAQQAATSRQVAASGGAAGHQRAAKPSLLDRLLGRSSTPQVQATPVSLDQVALMDRTMTGSVALASVPIPKLRPSLVAPDPLVVLTPPPATAAATAAASEQILPTGRFVKRPFNWPGS